MEGMSDVFQIFEEVQMILFYIKNDTDLREEVKKTVCVLTGFRNKCLRFTDTDVTTDCF